MTEERQPTTDAGDSTEVERPVDGGDSSVQRSRYPIWYVVIAFLLIAGGMVVRVQPAATNSFWTDEFFHAFEALDRLEGGDYQMPTGVWMGRANQYTFLIAQSFALFGESELSARLPSLLFSLGSLLLVAFYVPRVLSPLSGMFALLYFSLDLNTVEWSFIARMYAPLDFAVLATLFVGLDLIEHGPGSRIAALLKGGALAALIVFGSAMHLLYIMPFGALTGAILLYLTFRHRKYLWSILVFRVFFYVWSVLFLCLAYWLIMNPNFFMGQQAGGLLSRIVKPDLGIFETVKEAGRYFPVGLLLSLFFLRRCSVPILWLATAACAVFFVFLTNFQDDRYYRYAMQMLFLLSAAGWGGFLPWLRDRLVGWKAPRFVAAIIAGAIGAYSFYDSPQQSAIDDWEDYRGELQHVQLGPVVEYLRDNYREGDLVLTTIPLGTLYYLGEDRWDYPLLAVRHSHFPNYAPPCVLLTEEGKFRRYWGTPINSESHVYEPYGGVEIAVTTAVLNRALSRAPRTWVVADENRWHDRVRDEVREAIEDSAELVFEAPRAQLYLLPQGPLPLSEENDPLAAPLFPHLSADDESDDTESLDSAPDTSGQAPSPPNAIP